MKHKNRIFIIVAIIFIILGLAGAGIVAGSYFLSSKSVENKIAQFDNRASNDNSNIKNDFSDESESKKVADDKNDENATEGKQTSTEHIMYDVDTESLKKDSLAYNEALKSVQSTKLTGNESYTYAALDLQKYGIYDNIYGYITAPSIGMELPIYLGANDYNMSYGAGHFCYTSLPIGGESTNVVLAGHTGYIGKWLFDSIRYLNVGDRVSIKTYLGTLDYKVTVIKIKDPTESEDIFIEKGKDKLTLVTCIYASEGKYNRCIVICER